MNACCEAAFHKQAPSKQPICQTRGITAFSRTCFQCPTTEAYTSFYRSCAMLCQKLVVYCRHPTYSESIVLSNPCSKQSQRVQTQYLRTLVPKTIPLMAFETRILKYWVLGPFGSCKRRPRSGSAGAWALRTAPPQGPRLGRRPPMVYQGLQVSKSPYNTGRRPKHALLWRKWRRRVEVEVRLKKRSLCSEGGLGGPVPTIPHKLKEGQLSVWLWREGGQRGAQTGGHPSHVARPHISKYDWASGLRQVRLNYARPSICRGMECTAWGLVAL